MSEAETARLMVLLTVLPLAGVVSETVGGVVSEAAAWVTVTVCAATVIVPVRALKLVFADTEKPTVPLPVPSVPEVIVIQDAPLMAVQLQPAPAVTVRLLPLPAEGNVAFRGEMIKAQFPLAGVEALAEPDRAD